MLYVISYMYIFVAGQIDDNERMYSAKRVDRRQTDEWDHLLGVWVMIDARSVTPSSHMHIPFRAMIQLTSHRFFGAHLLDSVVLRMQE